MISLETLQILTPLQKLPKNVGDFGKLIFTLVNLVTLLVTANFDPIFEAYNSSVKAPRLGQRSNKFGYCPSSRYCFGIW